MEFSVCIFIALWVLSCNLCTADCFRTRGSFYSVYCIVHCFCIRMLWMSLWKKCSLKFKTENVEYFWLNGDVKLEKNWVRQDSLQEMKMWCPTTGKNSRQWSHVPCRDNSVVEPEFEIFLSICSKAEPILSYNSFTKALYFASETPRLECTDSDETIF